MSTQTEQIAVYRKCRPKKKEVRLKKIILTLGEGLKEILDFLSVANTE